MAEIKKPESVKLFVGLISGSKEKFFEVEKLLQKKYGKIDFESETISFDFTEYYKEEMGGNLFRKWVSFEKLIGPEELSNIKTQTNSIENKFTVSGKRCINIDPGYLALSKIVLASTKDFSHRIYLSKGIFAEITLNYKQKQFVPLPWTYPDYTSETSTRFFSNVRSKYHSQITNI
ncbi:MAG: DUF4416 family protein [Elusimicrobia bacterium]|nr:DUF4416 family protein [Elusimicrobiota bacterium]